MYGIESETDETEVIQYIAHHVSKVEKVSSAYNLTHYYQQQADPRSHHSCIYRALIV